MTPGQVVVCAVGAVVVYAIAFLRGVRQGYELGRSQK